MGDFKQTKRMCMESRLPADEKNSEPPLQEQPWLSDGSSIPDCSEKRMAVKPTQASQVFWSLQPVHLGIASNHELRHIRFRLGEAAWSPERDAGFVYSLKAVAEARLLGFPLGT